MPLQRVSIIYRCGGFKGLQYMMKGGGGDGMDHAMPPAGFVIVIKQRR
jgi:hypothetical protein